MDLKKIILDDSSKLKNLEYITFSGLANGLNLNKSNNINNLKGSYIKIRTIDISYYTNTNNQFSRQTFFDNNAGTVNANTRYDLLPANIKIDPNFFQLKDFTPDNNSFNLFIDNNIMPLFPGVIQASSVDKFQVPDHMNLNAIIPNLLTNTIDVQILIQFFTRMDLISVAQPLVMVVMLVEKLGNTLDNALQF